MYPVNILELPCPAQPPPILPGEGTERNYNPEITTYRCPNGYQWEGGIIKSRSVYIMLLIS